MCIKSVVVDKCATCEDEMKTHIVERPCPKAGGVFEGCGKKATPIYSESHDDICKKCRKKAKKDKK